MVGVCESEVALVLENRELVSRLNMKKKNAIILWAVPV